MSHLRDFDDLLHEFQRVGVDPNTISAGIAIRPEQMRRLLRSLPDNAGPEAFLTKLRVIAINGQRG